MINKSIHADIQEIIANFPAILLYGPRQIGKTTLSKQIASESEVKYSNTPVLSRGYYECISDLQTSNNFVITPNSQKVITRDGIKVTSVLDFLKTEIAQLG